MTLNPDSMVVQVTTRAGTLVMAPESAPKAPNGILWRCAAGNGLKPNALPQSCK